MALTTKRAICLLLYFLPCQMHQKRTKKLFLLTWRMALTTKRAFFFLSELHLSRKGHHLYFLPCQMHQEKDKKLYLLTTWRSKRTLFVLFALPNASEKDKNNCSFWLHEQWLSPQKEQLFLVLFWAGGSERHKNCYLRLAHHQKRNLSLSGEENVRPAVLMSTLNCSTSSFSPLHLLLCCRMYYAQSLRCRFDFIIFRSSRPVIHLGGSACKKKSTRLQIESTYIFPHSQKKFRIEIYQQKGICGLLWKFFKSKKGSRNGRTDYQLQQDVGILCTPPTWFVNVPQWYDGSSLISIHCMQMQLTWFWLQNIYWHHVI